MLSNADLGSIAFVSLTNISSSVLRAATELCVGGQELADKLWGANGTFLFVKNTLHLKWTGNNKFSDFWK